MSAMILGKGLKNSLIEYALTTFYGIGLTTSQRILTELKIPRSKRANDLSEMELSSLTHYLRDKISIEANLRNQVKTMCLELVKKGCYRGKRHVLKLPVRGQRTSTNARTNKRLGRRYVL